MLDQNKNIKKWYFKYIICDCSKRSTVLLGYKGYVTLNVIMYAVSIIMVCLAIFVDAPLFSRIVALLIFTYILFINPFILFTQFKKDMLDSGHQTKCSKKIAMKELLYSNLYNQFDPDVNVRIKNNH